MTKYDKVCEDCGSADVVADAYCQWNFKTQQWEVVSTYDKGGYCNTCDAETRIESIEIKDQK